MMKYGQLMLICQGFASACYIYFKQMIDEIYCYTSVLASSTGHVNVPHFFCIHILLLYDCEETQENNKTSKPN